MIKRASKQKTPRNTPSQRIYVSEKQSFSGFSVVYKKTIAGVRGPSRPPAGVGGAHGLLPEGHHVPRDRRPRRATRQRWVALGLSLCFFASQASAMTLKRAIEETLRTNPEILSAWKNMLATERLERLAYAPYFPTIDLSSSYGRDVNDNGGTRAVPGNKDHTLTMTKGEVTVTLTQTLFDGFRTPETVKQAKLTTRSAGFDFDNVAETVVWGAIQSYLNNMKLREILELTKDNVLLHQRTLKKLKQKAQAGGGGKADVQQTTSKLAMVSAGHASGQVALKNAQAHFAQVVGLPPRKLVRPNPPFRQLPTNLEDALAQAMQYHPQILSALANLAGAEAGKSAAKGAFMPAIGYGLNYTNKANDGGTPGHTKNAAALLTMQYNLSRGGADMAMFQELNERMKQRQDMLDLTRRTIREGVTVAWEGLQTTRERMRQLVKYVTINREASKTNREQFKLGKKTILDVLGVENELFGAEVAFSTEDWTAVRAVYQLLASMGRLRQTLEIHNDSDRAQPILHDARFQMPSEDLKATNDMLSGFQAAEEASESTPPSQEASPETSTETSEASEASGGTPTEASAKPTKRTPTEASTELSEGTPTEASAEPSTETATKTSEKVETKTPEEIPEEIPEERLTPDEAIHTNPWDRSDSTTTENQAFPWRYADAVTRHLKAANPWQYADAVARHLKSASNRNTAPNLILTGQYAISESSIFIFTQLVRIEDNRVISSVTEEIPLTWRLQKTLGLPTSTLKAIGHSAQATSP